MPTLAPMGPNNSFNPTAGVGQLIKQPSRAGGGLILVLGPMKSIALQCILVVSFAWVATCKAAEAETAGIRIATEASVTNCIRLGEIRGYAEWRPFSSRNLLRKATKKAVDMAKSLGANTVVFSPATMPPDSITQVVFGYAYTCSNGP